MIRQRPTKLRQNSEWRDIVNQATGTEDSEKVQETGTAETVTPDKKVKTEDSEKVQETGTAETVTPDKKVKTEDSEKVQEEPQQGTNFTLEEVNAIIAQIKQLDPEGEIGDSEGSTWQTYQEFVEDSFDSYNTTIHSMLKGLLTKVQRQKRARTTQTSTFTADLDAFGDEDFETTSTTKAGFLGEVYKKSLQKEIFYKSQVQRSPKIKRFAKFEQFLPSTKSEGFRTTPLPSVQQFSEFCIDLASDPAQFYNVLGKYPFSDEKAPNWGPWSYLTSKYGKITADGKDKSSGIGTILILLRRNGHAQMVVPSVTPIETSQENSVWSPIAEFVSRPELMGFDPDSTVAIQTLKDSFGVIDETLVKKLSNMAKSFLNPENKNNPTSGLQMLRYVRSWKQSKPSALQRRMVMPILIFKEIDDEDRGLTYEFKFRIKGTAFRSPYQMNMDAMVDSMEQSDVTQGAGDNIPQDVKDKINQWASFVRNNPLLSAPLGRRSRSKRRVKRRR